ncbi:MAG: hypothetical protein FWF29_07500, partial [Treponema sp.]|nr:hypothetical protein [Treponema sp.]
MIKVGALKEVLKDYTMVFILAGLIIMFSILSPSFLSLLNLRNLIVQNSHILIVAVGISFVMMSGSLDLSVGYQVSAIGVLTAKLMTVFHVNPILAMLCGILLGISLGFTNGFVAVALKIEPLVVTIATATIFQGISYLISKGAAFPNLPVSFRFISRGTFLGISTDI